MAQTFNTQRNVSAKSKEKSGRLREEPAFESKVTLNQVTLQDKKYFRDHFRTLLRILPFKLQKSEKIFRLAVIQKEILLAHNVMIYLDFQDEVKTWKLLVWLSDHGKRIFVPVWNKKRNEIIPFEIKDLQAFQANFDKKRSENLTGGQSLVLMDDNVSSLFDQEINTSPALDLIFVPGVTFDVHGNRVGRGFGTYDKFLVTQKEAKKVGLAYYVQVVDQLPINDLDVPMDMIISEDLVLRI